MRDLKDLKESDPKEALRILLSSPPPKLVFLARSFGRHALELGNEIPERPLYFLKAPNALVSPDQPVILPSGDVEVHYEAEVAVIIGDRLSRASASEAERAISGWTVLNDVTARSQQREDKGRFTRAKGYDTFCPIAPEPLAELDWRSAHLEGWLNGIKVQSAPLTDMLFTPGEALAAISSVMTLYPGDLVSLGTPAGVGALRDGDTFEVRLSRVVEITPDEIAQETLISLTHRVVSRAH